MVDKMLASRYASAGACDQKSPAAPGKARPVTGGSRRRRWHRSNLRKPSRAGAGKPNHWAARAARGCPWCHDRRVLCRACSRRTSAETPPRRPSTKTIAGHKVSPSGSALIVQRCHAIGCRPGSRLEGVSMTDDLWRLDATELARLIRLGRVSSREATESCLSRLHAVNPAINAVVRVLEEEALAAADAADAARARGDALGPLHGVPVTVKVNTDQDR